MQLRTLHFALFLIGGALSALAADGVTGWIPARQHPEVEYRLKCKRGSLTIEWRSAYPGAVTLTANVRGSGYDGDEKVVIPPGGSVSSDLETMYCSAQDFQITEKRFSMANPPPPPPSPAVAAKPEQPKAPAPLVPTVAPWVPPAPLPELAPETLALIHVGMKREEVLRKIGSPTSKLAIPEENELVETYRYPVSPGRAGTIRFSNGTVTEVIVPQP